MMQEATLFTSQGVTMPPRPRPDERDAAVVAAAADAFAAEASRRSADVLDGTPAAEFRREFMHVLSSGPGDAMDLAKAMERRFGYEMGVGLIELMGEWPSRLSRVHEGHVAAWVAETRPPAPFGTLSRVVARTGWGDVAGVAYRTPAHDARARCLLVPDGERDRYVLEGAFAGGIVVDWEDVEVSGPAGAEDAARHRAMADNERRRARETAEARERAAREDVFRKAAYRAERGAEGKGDAEVRAELSACLTALSAGEVDAAGKQAAMAVGLLAALRGRVPAAAVA